MTRKPGKKIYVKKDEFQNAMLRAGYNGPALAKELFISRQALNFTINGINGIAPANAKRAAQLLGKDFDDIFFIKDCGIDGRDKMDKS